MKSLEIAESVLWPDGRLVSPDEAEYGFQLVAESLDFAARETVEPASQQQFQGFNHWGLNE